MPARLTVLGCRGSPRGHWVAWCNTLCLWDSRRSGTQLDTHCLPHTKATSYRLPLWSQECFKAPVPVFKNLYSLQPPEDDCSSRAFSIEMQPMAEARNKPKWGCRTQNWQDSHKKLALTVKIKLWRRKGPCNACNHQFTMHYFAFLSASYWRLPQKPVLWKALWGISIKIEYILLCTSPERGNHEEIQWFSELLISE